MLAMVFLFTAVVATLNSAELARAGTVTFAGTDAFVGLLLARVTTKPPAGAALVKVTVPIEFDPPTTVVGLKVIAESAAGAEGLTASVADLATPEYAAVMFPSVIEPTAVVLTVKFAEVALAGTVTELGTVAAGLALDSVTKAPLAGAGPLRPTVPVADWPPVTLEGFTAREFNDACPTGGGL
jgi:hypothetical protein